MNTAEIYAALVEAMHGLKPDPFTGQFERHRFVELLGEVGYIWPVTVLDDPARGYELGRVNLKAAS